MNLQELQNSNYICYSVIAGSHAYGTATPTSDIDIRGIFVLPDSYFTSLSKPPMQISDNSNDVTYYELNRFFELAKDCNPNIIELLWVPDDCISISSPIAQKLIDNRHLFISKKAYHTFSGYAFSQIKRAKGQNKWINNPQPEERPRKEDFCSVLSKCYREHSTGMSRSLAHDPVSLKDAGIDLKQYHVAKMNATVSAAIYRLYFYGDDAKGVIRDDQIVCESIPLSDEHDRYSGLLLYNEQGYEAAVRNWKNYWDWRKERNEHRYKSQEAGEIDYDSKNMLHCMRLLWSGENILKYGEPIVKFSGDKLQILQDIRNGKYDYETIMEIVESKMEELKSLVDVSTIPHSVNMKAISALYDDLRSMI
jgi:predicted nucleotidyltransferase